ncbi:hypothetical protein ACKVMT_03690 [Halobacteriales archaeon Cl-PHB]
MNPSRRRLVAGGLAGLGTLLAGCSDDDGGPGLVAVKHYVAYAEGVSSIDYPHDVEVRVTVENGASERRSGVLQIDLRRVETGDGNHTVTDSWRREVEVSLGRGATRQERVVFEDVADRDDSSVEWEASVRIVAGTATPS